MKMQPRSLGSPHHAAAANPVLGPVLAGLFAVALGIVTFRAVLKACDDTTLALLGPVLLFLLGASLFAGESRRRS